MRYLLFGSSTSFGEIDPQNGGWAGSLRKYLDEKENHCFFHNLAISGNTSDDLLRRIETETKERLRNKPKEEWTMFISIGTNDSRLEEDQPKVSEEQYRNNMTKILTLAKQLVGRVIIVGEQPVLEEVCNPFKGRIYFLNERIKKYGAISKECAEKAGVERIEIFRAFQK